MRIHADPRLDSGQIEEPVAGDVNQRVHRHFGQQVQRLADIDVGGAEQRLADGLAELVHAVGDGEARRLEEDPPGERQAVAVDAAAGDADDAVSRPHVGPGIDRVERHAPDSGPRQVEARVRHRALDDVAHRGDLAARDGDAGLPRAFREARAHRRQHRGLRALDGDVVDQRDGPRADTDEVVDVHRHAVDADGVVAARHLRDQRLGADPVGADGDSDAAEIEDAREIAEADLDRAEAAVGIRPCGADVADEAGEPRFDGVGVDAGAAVVRAWAFRRRCHALISPSHARGRARASPIGRRPARIAAPSDQAGRPLSSPPIIGRAPARRQQATAGETMSSKTTATPENALSKAEIDERLAAGTLARLASYREDGMIHLTPIWFDWNGEVFRLTLGAGRIHLKNLARDPRVSILIDRDPRVDEGAQGLGAGAWAIMCRGNATLSQNDALIREATVAVLKKALGPEDADKYAEPVMAEGRTIVTITPQDWLTWDYNKADD